jgi:hypothetical protein
MYNPTLKASLLNTGDEAFLSLMQQIQHLLDLIDFYMARWPSTGSAKDDGLALKHEDLKLAVNTLGTLPYQLADQLRRWKHEEPRVLSRIGVELELLNEIWSTVEALTLFFIRADIDLHPFNRQKAEQAFQHLVRVNRILD